MKVNRLVLVSIALVMGLSVAAQGVYVAPRAGYSLGLANNVLGNAMNAQSTSLLTGSLGGGFNTGLSVGYMITKEFGVELNAAYLFGAQQTMADVTLPTREVDAFAYTRQLRITPSVVLTTCRDGIAPYTRIGAVIPVWGKTTVENTTIENNVPSYSKMDISGRFSIGLNGALGLNVPVGERLGLFAEADFIALNIFRNESEVLAYTVGESDLLAQLPVSKVKTVFVDEMNAESNANGADVTRPANALTSASSYTAVGLNIGFRVRL